MIKKSKFDEVATLFGLVIILVAFLSYINKGNFSTDSVQFQIFIPTVVAIIFPLFRLIRINALAYAICTWFILSYLIGMSSIALMMIVIFCPISIFFLAGIIESKGHFLKGLVLSWWGFVFYDLYNLGILNKDFINYLGERQYSYAFDQYLLIIGLAIIYKFLVHLTLKPIYVSTITNDKIETNPYNHRLKLAHIKKISISEEEEVPEEYYTAHVLVQDLFDRGVISKNKLKYYANLKGSQLIKQLSENNLINSDDISKYSPNKKVNEGISFETDQDFASDIEINYVENDAKGVKAEITSVNKNEKLPENACSQCNKYPCKCCQSCFTYPCSCCHICGHPKRWCNCF
ncbi:hypothetical protein CIB95_07765 [Lottiidibacillus patelloidae]|uniref:Uncharacterized protein n=1 Tax=Lottiidibacillus patelloidae TaxID=2670334 RepID=A0A263BUE7_9BACI|nr:hypothetical protein [Lottiidibacillus patelloidae]OZM57349.1 hypothetical protein CIB95_07765 [Lottiidibacillus patelloidae]